MKFTENKDLKVTKVYEPCELAKPLRYTRKDIPLLQRVTKIGDKIHCDVVRIKPSGINR
jgi:hypothetical protein